MALGINMIAGIAGSFIGLVLGGVLADINWRLVFWVNVPFGVFGTVWAYLKLKEIGVGAQARIDWWGNITFAVGLILVLIGITYGIQPYGDHTMGWTSPWCWPSSSAGVALLVVFVPDRDGASTEPMFNLSCSGSAPSRPATSPTSSVSIGRGGLQFMLIIWLQGIWLPLHGYNFVDTPLWAGIYMLPLTARVPRRRAGLGLALGPLRRAALRHRRHAPRRAQLRVAHAAAGQLRVPGVRGAAVAERHRHRAVRRAEHDRDHERVCRPTAGAASGMRATFRNIAAWCCRSACSSR